MCGPKAPTQADLEQVAAFAAYLRGMTRPDSGPTVVVEP